MFTGLIEDVGTVQRVDRRSDAAVLTIAPRRMPVEELALGESVACSGVCLTVTEKTASTFTVLAGRETLSLTTIGGLRPQSRINLERALAVGDRLGGHMVAGHVDGLGTVASRQDRGANLVIGFSCDRALLRYIIHKGSIAVDGISLTVNHVDERGFDVALIPHTVNETTLADRRVGDKINLEVDLVGKYVEKLVGGYRSE